VIFYRGAVNNENLATYFWNMFNFFGFSIQPAYQVKKRVSVRKNEPKKGLFGTLNKLSEGNE
jgi:hypothetical protein